MEKKRLSLYLWLFKVNFFISAFTFGGGYVVIPMIRKYFVTSCPPEVSTFAALYVRQLSSVSVTSNRL